MNRHAIRLACEDERMDATARTAYLELMKQTLTRYLVIGEERRSGRRRPLVALLLAWLARRNLTIVSTEPAVPVAGHGLLRRVLARRGLALAHDPHDSTRRLPIGSRRSRLARLQREFGIDWPAHAETMVGLRRLDNVEHCIETVLTDHVPGDLIEAGVWRGGTSIFMRAVLAAHDDPARRVWVADSFEGLPKPNADAFPADAGLDYTVFPELSVGVQQVRANFARYGLLDDRVDFLVGWFKDTLPSAPIEQLAVMRLDGDLYESTMDALEALYPRLSVGGFCIIDDYGALEACRRAVNEYRAANDITEPILPVDWTGAYWRRERN
jgi:O-methyltransferase